MVEVTVAATATAEQVHQAREAFASPGLVLHQGPGEARRPGVGNACTMQEINLVLTGRPRDECPPCVDRQLRDWVIRIQDAMPHDVRNGPGWRAAAPELLNTADGSGQTPQRRQAVFQGWAWHCLMWPGVLLLLPETQGQQIYEAVRSRDASELERVAHTLNDSPPDDSWVGGGLTQRRGLRVAAALCWTARASLCGAPEVGRNSAMPAVELGQLAYGASDAAWREFWEFVRTAETLVSLCRAT